LRVDRPLRDHSVWAMWTVSRAENSGLRSDRGWPTQEERSRQTLCACRRRNVPKTKTTARYRANCNRDRDVICLVSLQVRPHLIGKMGHTSLPILVPRKR
jgi:hypothetical protein